ncbi:MAG: WD40 repeat domain-containing protein [Chloroflexi bacterium]|nr:WD40 repeat domain-containing protein [Chloroflexota bacterium]
MLNKLSATRKGLILLIYALFLAVLWGYSFLEENYFPEDTECSMSRRLSGTQCIFSVKSLGQIGYFTADSQSIIFVEDNATRNVLKIEPIAQFDSIFSGKRFEHPFRIWTFALSPDRTKAVTCIAEEGEGGSIEYWIWDIEHSNLIKKIDASPYGCVFMTFSADGKSLMLNLVGRNQIGKLNLDTGRLWEIEGNNFAVAPDGHSLVVQDAKGIKVLKYPEFEFIRDLEIPDNGFQMHFSFSADSKFLAGTNNSGDLAVWSVKNGALLSHFQLDSAFCVPAFSPKNEKWFSCFRENQSHGLAYESYVFQWGPDFYNSSTAPLRLEQVIKLGSRKILPFKLDVSPNGEKLLVADDSYIQVLQIAEP